MRHSTVTHPSENGRKVNVQLHSAQTLQNQTRMEKKQKQKKTQKKQKTQKRTGWKGIKLTII